MTCTDCKEPVTETDRLNKRTCVGCRGDLHAECSMAGVDEEDLCELCHDLQRAAILEAMSVLGVEA